MPPERPIFVVGSPRSGTTLLRDLLRAHPRLTFGWETAVVPELYELHGDPADERAARRLARDLLASVGFARFATGLRPDDLAHHRTFAALVSDLYAARARREGKPRWGDKTPFYACSIPVLRTIFPDAQVVHLIRDGRDVVASLLRQPWGPARALAAAELWRDTVTAGRSGGRTLPAGAYVELRYEDLVAEPEHTLSGLCDALGERFDPVMLRPNRLMPEHGRVPAWRAAHAGDVSPKAVGEWRDALDADERAIVAGAAGGLLAELGYDDVDAGRTCRPGERARWRSADAVKRMRWRATTWDRVPRLREDAVLWRARLRRRVAG